ncbi:MAG TPA: 2-oxoacid:acceptor oxidoreductase family protein [Thermoplasmataceae archaeon]|nr:2-oxoacid:acceptor oxidoreductase family protein [Thermoplasmataceae archaeon]
MNRNILIAGVGGQGIITAGAIIAGAATASGFRTVMSEIHGLSQRGGSVLVEVRIGEAYSPITPQGKADVMIGFEPLETLRYLNRCSPDCKVVMSSIRTYPIYLGLHGLKYPSDQEIWNIVSKFSALRVNPSELFDFKGDMRPVNVLILGVASGWGILEIEPQSIIDEIKKRFSGKNLSRNMDAFNAGYLYGTGKSEQIAQGIE